MATQEDISQISHLHSTNWQGIYRGMLSDKYLDNDIFEDRKTVWQQRFDTPKSHQRILVACENNIVCGFICIYIDNHNQWGTLIENLHISKHYKGQGVGKKLLTAATQIAYQHAPDNGLYLEVLTGNVDAQKFYQKLGAFNEKTQTWQAPDGSYVQEFVYRWETIKELVE
jgi:ribosomal protein S18 acetylase RimI-like enzyme